MAATRQCSSCRVPLAGALALLILLDVRVCSAFYLPFLVPVDYQHGEPIDVFASKVTSNANKIPYDYASFPFCVPTDRAVAAGFRVAHRGLGAVFAAERQRRTGYDVHMATPVQCAVLCDVNLKSDEIRVLIRRVQQKYRVHLSLDDMPAVAPIYASGDNRTSSSRLDDIIDYELGYSIGQMTTDSQESSTRLFLNNHLKLTIMYHVPAFTASEQLLLSGNTPYHRVVGFHVEASSAKGGLCGDQAATSPLELPSNIAQVSPDTNIQVAFTYEVVFEKEERIAWVTRWDPLLESSTERKSVQWFALANGILVGLLMTALIALILLRTVYKDLVQYRSLDLAAKTQGFLDEDVAAEYDSGWKILRGDVFRPPPTPAILSIMVGTGAHLVLSTLFTLLFAMLGFLSPSYRGSFLVAMIVFWVVTSSVSGYFSTRLYRNFGGTNWKHVAIGVALVFPGLVFAIFFALNLFLWAMGSTGAAPVLSVILMLLLWLGVSAPLTYMGGYLGQSGKMRAYPVRTNTMPRQIPRQPRTIGLPLYLAAGSLPFGVICLELLYILNSLWQNEIYSVFSFLGVVCIILCLVCAETAVLVVYVKLLHEDYRWWWQGFNTSAVSGAYVFLYSVFYMIWVGEVGQGNLASAIVYLSYMGLLSTLFSLGAGSVGFFASLWFVRKVFSAIRSD